jgi:type II secretory pathway component PulF
MSLPQPNPLSDNEARQLAEHLSLVTQAGLPLAPALRVTAQEIPNRRLSQALTALFHDLESGQSLENILESNPHFLPPYMRRLIETGSRSGNLPEVLVQLVEIDRTSADLGRSIRQAIAYPVFLMILTVVLTVFLAWYVMPQLSQVFADFKTALPMQTVVLMWLLREGGWRLVAILCAIILIVIVVLRVSLSAPRWRRIVMRIPFVGPMLLWRGVADWSRLAALYLDQGLPLPESLSLAAAGVNDSFVAAEGVRLSQSVVMGRKLGEVLSTTRRLPASLIPLVSWGENQGALPEAFRTASEMFENRIQLRSVLLQSILPPIAFIVVLLLAFWLIGAMLLPMVHLINDLSGGPKSLLS